VRYGSERRGISPTVTTAILAAITAAIGLAVFGIASGWSSIAALDFVGEVDKGVQQLKAELVFEHGYIGGGTMYIWVKNTGEIDLVITAIVVYDPDSSPPTPSFSKVAEVKRGETILYKTSSCGDKCLVDVYYVPAPLFDEHEPEKNRDRFLKLTFGIGEMR